MGRWEADGSARSSGRSTLRSEYSPGSHVRAGTSSAWRAQLTTHRNKYIWKKSGKDLTCVMDRRPDPHVEVCLARQGDVRTPGKISFLHYNIDRFLGTEIKDLRGLETLFIMR